MATQQRKTRPPAPPVEVTSKPEVMGGAPCIASTRIPVETIVSRINAQESAYEIYEDLVTLPPGAIEAAMEWAKANGRAVHFPVRRMYDTDAAERRERIRALRPSR